MMRKLAFLNILGWFWILRGGLYIIMMIYGLFFALSVIGLPIFQVIHLLPPVIAIIAGVGLLRRWHWIPYALAVLLAIDSYVVVRSGGAIIWIPLVITTAYVLLNRNLFIRNQVVQ